ncbi:hypothetical protein Syun_011893 [Stephania yunnanensis]|uniref:Uncharacterized protein n=1 Tax=Stephania yunnanensis TaxID=152371 RepID=A0AAP0PES0_9MAGN
MPCLVLIDSFTRDEHPLSEIHTRTDDHDPESVKQQQTREGEDRRLSLSISEILLSHFYTAKDERPLSEIHTRMDDHDSDIRHGTSGFGFDSTSNMVTAPEDVWEDYLRDAFEDVNDVHDSSSTSEPLTVPIEEFDATPTSSRTRTTTADGRGNETKKKRKVSNDVYIGDQMVAAVQIVANEISKVTSAIRVEHDLRESFINAMAEVHELLTDVERAIHGKQDYGSRGAYGRIHDFATESDFLGYMRCLIDLGLLGTHFLDGSNVEPAVFFWIGTMLFGASTEKPYLEGGAKTDTGSCT